MCITSLQIRLRAVGRARLSLMTHQLHPSYMPVRGYPPIYNSACCTHDLKANECYASSVM
jgi:hypothetical protein